MLRLRLFGLGLALRMTNIPVRNSVLAGACRAAFRYGQDFLSLVQHQRPLIPRHYRLEPHLESALDKITIYAAAHACKPCAFVQLR